MKALIVFYSRTGKTKKVAETLSKNMNCDVEEIFDTKNRFGIKGFLISGFEAITKKLTELKEVKFDPSSYDVIFIGTPTWAANVSPAVRTYLSQFSDKLKKVVFFRTGSSEKESVFSEMEILCDRKPLGTLWITPEEISKNNYEKKVKTFVESIKKFF